MWEFIKEMIVIFFLIIIIMAGSAAGAFLYSKYHKPEPATVIFNYKCEVKANVI